jgi:hypothetical protein
MRGDQENPLEDFFAFSPASHSSFFDSALYAAARFTLFAFSCFEPPLRLFRSSRAAFDRILFD